MNIESTLTLEEQDLHKAVNQGDAPHVRRLLEAGVNPSVRDNTNRLRTPLHVAAYKNQADCVELLLNAGAQVDALDPDAKTALHTAAGVWGGGTDTVKLLIDAGAQIDGRPIFEETAVSMFHGTCYEGTPLHIAVAARSLDKVNLLLQAGADVNAKMDLNAKGSERPLHTAAFHGVQAAIIESLVAAGAKLDLRNDMSDTPLQLAAQSVEHGGTEDRWKNINVLLESGANPHVKCWRSSTPADAIHLAVTHAQTEPGLSPVLLAAALATQVKLDAITPESIAASARARKLEALLPQVQKQTTKQDDWHPGMTAPAIEAPASTETNAQQIQTLSHSQGLRF